MNEPTTADRYRKVAGTFTSTVQQVPPGKWDDPSPCEGWVARDIVRHLVEWVPPFLGHGADVDLPELPSVDDDPARAWDQLSRALQTLLDDPAVSTKSFHNEHTGTLPLDDAIDRFILGDILIHTWDLARATGQDDTLDANEVARMLVGIEPMGDVLEQSGHYGPRLPVRDDADDQTKLLAYLGRRV